MKKSKTMKKLIVGILTFVLTISACAIGAFAWEHPDRGIYVELYANQFKAYSGSFVDKYMWYEGKNTSAKQRVYFQMQYKENGSWKNDSRYFLASPGAILGKTSSTNLSYDATWRLCLDPYGIVNGATAYGWTW